MLKIKIFCFYPLENDAVLLQPWNKKILVKLKTWRFNRQLWNNRLNRKFLTTTRGFFVSVSHSLHFSNYKLCAAILYARAELQLEYQTWELYVFKSIIWKNFRFSSNYLASYLLFTDKSRYECRCTGKNARNSRWKKMDSFYKLLKTGKWSMLNSAG